MVERASDLVGFDESIRTVQQQDVDVVGLQRAQRPLDLAHDAFVREVEVRALANDARLGLQGDLGALRWGELHRLGEALLALVHVRAVHVGMVEEVDARVAGCPDECAHLVVARLGDAHESQHDVRDGGGGGSERDGSDGWHPSTLIAGAGAVEAEDPSMIRKPGVTNVVG